MACKSCNTGGGCSPNGCGDAGHCSTGSCNRMNTFDWLNGVMAPASERTGFDIVEISFKNGARKQFFRKPHYIRAITGDVVAVESTQGYDMGRISLSGELVKLQMKKHKVRENAPLPNVLRIANERDLERFSASRAIEKEILPMARIMARDMRLEMKVGDVEVQGDGRKATFYYTAEGRVDFRELIRLYAQDFKLRIEMRQIGARQESSRVGGLGPCGRELCCASWLHDFKSVSTSAARYQNLALNQAKLTGQCGRLKCCLNYELDMYIEALKGFPQRADRIQTISGQVDLIKTDIFKRLMYYSNNDRSAPKVYTLPVERVFELLDMNKRGEKAPDLIAEQPKKEDRRRAFSSTVAGEEENEHDFVSVTGEIELKDTKSRNKRKKRPEGLGRPPQGAGPRPERGDRPQGPRPERQPMPQRERPPIGSSPNNNRPAAPQPPRQERNNGDNNNNRPPQGPRPERPQGDNPNRPPQGPRPERPQNNNPNRPPQGPRPERPQGDNSNRPPQGPRPERPQNNNNPNPNNNGPEGNNQPRDNRNRRSDGPREDGPKTPPTE